MPTLQKAEQDKYIIDYSPLVKKIAYYFMARLPASVQVDDLIQAGLVGLLEAVRNFDNTQGAQFETYATQRIRGAILDELRQIDWLPRSARKNQRLIETAINQLEQQIGRQPSEQQIANALCVSLAQYQQMLANAKGYQLLYYEDFQSNNQEYQDFFEYYTHEQQSNPLDIIQDHRFREALVRAIKQLPEREKLVMALYYEQELNLKEIGQVLEVTESRVCQLHSQAIARIRGKLKDWIH